MNSTMVKPPETLRELQKYIEVWAKGKGWDFDQQSVPEKLMLVVSELSEALEIQRSGAPIHFVSYVKNEETPGELKPEGFPVEIADAMIRLLHLCANFKIDIHTVILEKMAYNEKRPYRHGGKLS